MTRKQLKKALYDLQENQARLIILKSRLDDLCYNDGLSSLSYDKEKTCKTNKFYSATESTALNNLVEATEIQMEYNKLSSHVKALEKAINALNDRDKEFIKLRYIDLKQMSEIQEVFNVSLTTACRYQDDVLDNICRILI